MNNEFPQWHPIADEVTDSRFDKFFKLDHPVVIVQKLRIAGVHYPKSHNHSSVATTSPVANTSTLLSLLGVSVVSQDAFTQNTLLVAATLPMVIAVSQFA